MRVMEVVWAAIPLKVSRSHVNHLEIPPSLSHLLSNPENSTISCKPCLFPHLLLNPWSMCSDFSNMLFSVKMCLLTFAVIKPDTDVIWSPKKHLVPSATRERERDRKQWPKILLQSRVISAVNSQRNRELYCSKSVYSLLLLLYINPRKGTLLCCLPAPKIVRNQESCEHDPRA